MRSFFILVSLVLLVSCNNFLEENPKSEIAIDRYFSTPDHARSVVNNLYRSGVLSFYDSNDYYGGTPLMYGGYISGLFANDIYKGQRPISQYPPLLTHTSKNISSEMDIVWNNCYITIARANTAIKYISSTPGLEESECNQLIATAKFFRAYNYFFLVKFFGDVPLITEPYESLENLYVSRTAAKDVYTQIIQDLKDALTGGLINDTFVNNGFRITQSVVETVLANVYLQMSGYPILEDHYADAAQMARNVIKSGVHKLVENGSTPERSAYNILRTSDTESEFIYTKEYVVNIAEQGWICFSFPPVGSSLGIFKYPATTNVYKPSTTIINCYDPVEDLRIQEKQFFFRTYTYVKNGEEQTLDLGEYCNWFWYDENAMLVTGHCEKDLPIYRYAEVLLFAAEAIANSEGVTPEAVRYLTDVRARAYTSVDRSKIEAELSSLSKDEFIHEVWSERLRELPLECKVWDDIQRTRMYPVTSDKNPGKVTFVPIVGATNPYGATYKERDLLWPISDNEIQRNPNLEQNLGF